MTIVYNAAGKPIHRSRNLRGLVDHGRRAVPQWARLSDTDGRFLTDEKAGQTVRRYELAVRFHNGDIAVSYWSDWRVCADWLQARRSWGRVQIKPDSLPEFAARYAGESAS